MFKKNGTRRFITWCYKSKLVVCLAEMLILKKSDKCRSGLCMAGEVGLSGEIRPVNRIEQRIGEAQKLGFKQILIPKHNLQGLDTKNIKIEITPVKKVEEAFRILFG